MKTTTEMTLVSIDKLIPYINNARTHSEEQIVKVKAACESAKQNPAEENSFRQLNQVPLDTQKRMYHQRNEYL